MNAFNTMLDWFNDCPEESIFSFTSYEAFKKVTNDTDGFLERETQVQLMKYNWPGQLAKLCSSGWICEEERQSFLAYAKERAETGIPA